MKNGRSMMWGVVAILAAFAVTGVRQAYQGWREQRFRESRTIEPPLFYKRQLVSLKVKPGETGMVLAQRGYDWDMSAHRYDVRFGTALVSVYQFELFSHTKESNK